MKDLLDPVLRYLPSFLPNFFRLMTGPKTAIVGWVEEDTGDLKRPLAFVACTIAIGFLLQLPLLGKDDDFSKLVAAMAVFKIVSLVTLGAVIHMCFRLVRGRASFSATLSAYLYLVSPPYLFGIILGIVMGGIVHSYDPKIAALEQASGGLLRNDPVQWSRFEATAPNLAATYDALSLAAFALIVIWLVASWGSFRRLHDRGWFAGTAATLLSFAVGIAVIGALNYLMVGMFRTASPILQ